MTEQHIANGYQQESAAASLGVRAVAAERAARRGSPHSKAILGAGTAPSVSLVIPVKNEARNIGWVLERIADDVDEVILVDGKSTDATLVTAQRCRPDVKVVAQDGVGKGSALRTGFLAASGDIIVMMDADGSMTPDEITHYVHFLANGYDFVKGSRFIAGGGSLDITRFRRIGNRFLLGVFNALYGAELTDLCYGFCAFHRRYLDVLALSATGFEIEAEMVVARHAARGCGSPRCRVSNCRDGQASPICIRSATASGCCGPCCAGITPDSAATSCNRSAGACTPAIASGQLRELTGTPGGAGGRSSDRRPRGPIPVRRQLLHGAADRCPGRTRTGGRAAVAQTVSPSAVPRSRAGGHHRRNAAAAKGFRVQRPGLVLGTPRRSAPGGSGVGPDPPW